MNTDKFKELIEKTASKGLTGAMASGAVLGAGIAASSAYDKSKDIDHPTKTLEKVIESTMTGAAGGSLAGIGVYGAKTGIKSGASKFGKTFSRLKKFAGEEKTAGIPRLPKVPKMVIAPAIVGGIVASEKAKEISSDNPYLSEEDSKRYVSGKTMAGVATWGGAGYGAYKLSKLPSGLAKGILKKAEIKVPREKDLTDDEAAVRESPNEDEIKDRTESITDESLNRNKYKYLIEKLAMESRDGYLKPINCEVCGYKGLPKSQTGMCPDCGTLGGKAVYVLSSVSHPDDSTREQNLTAVWDMAEETNRERLSYYS